MGVRMERTLCPPVWPWGEPPTNGTLWGRHSKSLPSLPLPATVSGCGHVGKLSQSRSNDIPVKGGVENQDCLQRCAVVEGSSPHYGLEDQARRWSASEWPLNGPRL